MPCSDTLAYDRMEEEAERQRMTRLLCSICKSHPELIKEIRGLKKWWIEHQKNQGHESD